MCERGGQNPPREPNSGIALTRHSWFGSMMCSIAKKTLVVVSDGCDGAEMIELDFRRHCRSRYFMPRKPAAELDDNRDLQDGRAWAYRWLQLGVAWMGMRRHASMRLRISRTAIPVTILLLLTMVGCPPPQGGVAGAVTIRSLASARGPMSAGGLILFQVSSIERSQL
jgi:hypothetical protein